MSCEPNPFSDFLAVLHPAGSIYCVCAFGDGGASWYEHPDSPHDGWHRAREIDALGKHHGVYHTVANLRERPAKGRGKEDLACDAWAVWADVDAIDFEPLAGIVASKIARGEAKSGAKEATWRGASDAERGSAMAAARTACESLPIGPPSALVNSGRGWHPYWFLAEAAKNLALVRAVNRRIAKLAHGDKCWDLARVLKVPGTHNRKDPEKPVPAEIVAFDPAARHDLEDLACKLGIPKDGETVPDDDGIPFGSGNGNGDGAARVGGNGDGKKTAPPKAKVAPKELPHPDERLRRARAWANATPGAIEHQRGHDRTFAVALALVRGFALEPDVARRIIGEWNPKCSPPWPDKDLDHKINDAAKSGKLELGYMFAEKPESDPELSRIRARFSHAAVAEMQSADEAFEADARADLGRLWNDDPGAYMEIKQRLAERFKSTFRPKDFEAAVKAAAQAQNQEARRASTSADWGLPPKMFPQANLPERITMVGPYSCDPAKGILRELPCDDGIAQRSVVVSPAPLFIVGLSIDISAKTEIVELAWRRGPEEWRRISVPRNAISERKDIIALSLNGFPANASNAVDVIQYLAAFENHNYQVLDKSWTTSSLGWGSDTHGPVGFMSGHNLIPARDNSPDVKFKGMDAGDDQLAGAIRPRGTLDGWRSAVARVGDFPRVAVAIYAALAPPLLAALDAPNFIVDWAGGTSSGKSSTLKIGASVWGSPDERHGGLVRGWDTTRVATETVACTMNHLPNFLDDSKRAKDKEIVSQILYDMASGSGRGRGTLTGTRKARPFHTVLLSTGEQPVTSFTHDGGTKARVLAIWGGPFEEESARARDIVRFIMTGIAAHHGVAGPAFVKWLVDHRTEAKAWKAARTAAIAEYANIDPDNAVAGRLAENMATLHVVASLAHEALALPWTEFAALLGRVWAEFVRGAHDADVASHALAYVAGWAAARAHMFYGRAEVNASGMVKPNVGWIGRWDPGDDFEFVGFTEAALKRALADGGHDWSVVRIWRDRQWLKADHDRLTQKAGLDGVQTRMVCVLAGPFCEVVGE